MKLTDFVRKAIAAAGRRRERARWDAKWGTGEFKPYWLQNRVHPEVRSAVETGWFRPPGRVLEIGCGLGFDGAWLAQRGFSVVGVDLSRAAIERAEDRFGNMPNLELEAADFCEPDAVGGRFDAVLDVGCLLVLGRLGRTAYRQSLLAKIHSGTRMLLIMNLNGVTPQERLDEVRAVLEPPFEIAEWRHAEIQGPDGSEVIEGAVFLLRAP